MLIDLRSSYGSTPVPCYLGSKLRLRNFAPLVSARVAEIQETLGSGDFRYIRSSDNPADTLTRGLKPERLQDWLAGPACLQLPEAEWPNWNKQPTPEVDATETERVLKPAKRQLKVKKKDTHPNINTATTTETDNPKTIFEVKLRNLKMIILYLHTF